MVCAYGKHCCLKRTLSVSFSQALTEEMDVQNETLSWLNKSGSHILSNSSLTLHDRDAHVNKLRQINISWSQVRPSGSLPVCLSLCPSVQFSVCLSFGLFVCVSDFCVSVCVIQFKGGKFNEYKIASIK